MKLAYIRVSTEEQNEARQLEAMKQYSIDKFFTEKVSGRTANRPKLQEMLEFAREGDIIHIHDLSRLARNLSDLLNIIETLNAKGIHLISNKENINTNTPTGRLMIAMLGAIYEFERENTLERQREGIAIAKAQGKYLGGKRKAVKNFDELYRKYLAREIPSKSALAKALNVSRPTLNRIIDDYNVRNAPNITTV